MRWVLVLIVALRMPILGDTVRLKTHSSLTGNLVAANAQSLQIQTAHGIESVAITNVESISFDDHPTDAGKEAVSSPAAGSNNVQEVEGYLVRLTSCMRNGTQSVTCLFQMTNLKADRQIGLGNVYEVDSQGIMQQAQQATLSSQRAVYNTPIQGRLVFGGVAPEVTSIAKLSMTFSSYGPSGNTSFEVVFRRVPLSGGNSNSAPGVPTQPQPRRLSLQPLPSIRPPSMIACSVAPEMPRMVLVGDTLVWVERDGSVAEKDVRADLALFAQEADGTMKQVGTAYDSASVDREGSPPNVVAGVTKARGVASVLVVVDRITKRPGIFGSTFETSGRQRMPVRVSLLADGGLAVWTEDGKPSVFSGERVRGLIRVSVAAIQDGRFLLTDGTVEDGVIERLENDPHVLAALPVGMGAARCEAVFGCLLATRSSRPNSSYTYKWQIKGTPVMCVKQIAFDLLLLQNGDLHRIAPEGRVVDEPILRNIADYSAKSKDEWVVVKEDGSLWYKSLQQSLEQIRNISDARRAWVADEGAMNAFQVSRGGANYWQGAWYVSTEGKFFRWGHSVSGQHNEPESNPVQLGRDLEGTAAMEIHGGTTIALRSDGMLLSWVPPQPTSDSFLDSHMRPARWIFVGSSEDTR